jgi:hypothetical protein
LHRGLQVRTGGESGVAVLLQRHELFLKVVLSVYIELIDRRAVVQQLEQLNLAGAQVDEGGFEIGFKLRALQLQTVQIHLRQVAGAEPFSIDVQLMVPIGQVVFGIL